MAKVKAPIEVTAENFLEVLDMYAALCTYIEEASRKLAKLGWRQYYLYTPAECIKVYKDKVFVVDSSEDQIEEGTFFPIRYLTMSEEELQKEAEQLAKDAQKARLSILAKKEANERADYERLKAKYGA